MNDPSKRWGEYTLINDHHDYRFLIERIDSLHQTLDGKMDENRERILRLTAIVTNGLSHRTTQTEADVREIKATMATREDLAQLLADRKSADEAWRQTRQARKRMLITLFVAPPVGASLTYGVQALIQLIGG